MKLYGGIYFDESGSSVSIRGMHLQTSILSTLSNNIVYYAKPGYQKQDYVVSPFAEMVGAHGLSKTTDTSVGRLRNTRNPLDLALAKEGYFQYQTPNGVKLSRDGRFKLDKDGNLLSLDNNKILSVKGKSIKLDKIPADLQDISIDTDGIIKVFDRTTKEQTEVAQISVVNSTGSQIKDLDVRQGYSEESNVNLYTETFNLLPIRRNFESNRQMFMLQNDLTSRVLSELGKTS